MTNSPADLISVRSFLRLKTGLPNSSLGIVGDTSHTSGYHVGNVPSTDYSRRESGRDNVSNGYASALDIGFFNISGRNLRGLSLFLVDLCRRNDPRVMDVREIIYSPDGVTVKRWDRLGIRSTGDSSHLTHTHVSFFRDSIGRRSNANNFLAACQDYFNGKDSDMAGETADFVAAHVPNPETGSDTGLHMAVGDVWRRVENIEKQLSELQKTSGVQLSEDQLARVSADMATALSDALSRLKIVVE